MFELKMNLVLVLSYKEHLLSIYTREFRNKILYSHYSCSDVSHPFQHSAALTARIRMELETSKQKTMQVAVGRLALSQRRHLDPPEGTKPNSTFGPKKLSASRAPSALRAPYIAKVFWGR